MCTNDVENTATDLVLEKENLWVLNIYKNIPDEQLEYLLSDEFGREHYTPALLKLLDEFLGVCDEHKETIKNIVIMSLCRGFGSVVDYEFTFFERRELTSFPGWTFRATCLADPVWVFSNFNLLVVVSAKHPYICGKLPGYEVKVGTKYGLEFARTLSKEICTATGVRTSYEERAIKKVFDKNGLRVSGPFEYGGKSRAFEYNMEQNGWWDEQGIEHIVDS